MLLDNCLIMVAREPVAGGCKTRLASSWGEERAALLYAAFLEDLAARLPREVLGCDLVVAYTPDSRPEFFAGWAGWQAMPQRGENLGERLEGLMETALARGYRRAVIMSSDSPDVPGDYLSAAFDCLGAHDAVMGPALDGGYYLIGARLRISRLFRDVPWSTSEVAATTRRRAAESGVTLCEVPAWYDIDTAADVRYLLGGAPAEHRPADAPRTVRLAQKWLAEP